jgi:hypothetical protein
VEKIRAQLATAGIVNPRRKKTSAPADDTRPNGLVADTAAVPPARSETKRPAAMPVERAREEVLRLAPWQIAPTTPAPRSAGDGSNGHHAMEPGPAGHTALERPQAVRTPAPSAGGAGPEQERVRSALPTEGWLHQETVPQSLLARLDHAALTGLLEYAIAHGWNCPGLLQFIRTQYQGATSRPV